jgi:hypothetical protein
MMLLPASCFLLPASCFLLPASCFLVTIKWSCLQKIAFYPDVRIQPIYEYFMTAAKN